MRLKINIKKKDITGLFKECNSDSLIKLLLTFESGKYWNQCVELLYKTEKDTFVEVLQAVRRIGYSSFNKSLPEIMSKLKMKHGLTYSQ